MLAGSIANNKLTNSAVTIAGNNISLGGSIDAATLRESLGLSNAMHFVGIATVAITDGSTTNPSISGYTTKQKGDVIIDKESAYEYVWTGSKWERLGGDGSYKTVQTAVADPTASGNSSTFIKTISQDKNGVITATKATIANHIIQVNGTAAATYNGGTAVTLNLKKGNGINITNSSGTITFAHSNSVTAKTAYGSTATTASANGGSITVTDVKYDAQGHITGSTDRKITLSQTTYTLAGLGGVPTSRTVNGKALTSNISLTAGDVGAATANHTHAYLPLAGGDMTGYISWGNVANAGLEWTTDNGTRIHIRPYSPANTFQITLQPNGGTEFGAFNMDTSGNISLSSQLNGGSYIIGKRFRAEADNDYPTYEFKANSQTNYGCMMQVGSTNQWGVFEYPKEFDGQSTRHYEGYRLPEPSTGLTANKNYNILTTKAPVSIAQGGTGATTVDAACANIGALRYKQYDNGYFETGAGNVSAWLQYQVNGTTKCQLDLTSSGTLLVNNSAVATEGRDNTFSGTLWVSNNKSAGGYVAMWEDNEGGNIAIASPNGKRFEIDAFDNTVLRCYSYDDRGNFKAMYFNRTNGELSSDGQMFCSGGKAVYHTGNIVYSSTQPAGSNGMIWLKPV